MDIIKTHVVNVGSTMASAGSAVTSGIVGQLRVVLSYFTRLFIIVFVGAAASVADGTRDAALDAARLSADAKDVAAFKAGRRPSRALCSRFLSFASKELLSFGPRKTFDDQV